MPRFSKSENGLQVFCVSGVNSLSFGIQASDEVKSGLLGFGCIRTDPQEKETYPLPGFKVFKSVISDPTPKTSVTTLQHPIQSFVWDDYTGKPGYRYTYEFIPMYKKGASVANLRRGPSVTIDVATELLVDPKARHDVFFNRGVAASQAFTRRWGDDVKKLDDEKKAWLTRDLQPQMLLFISRCKAGDGLRCHFYEFTNAAVISELAKAQKRGVDLQLVVSAKEFSSPSSVAAVAASGLDTTGIVLREHIAISHNKFMIFLPKNGAPTEVWTGSTNITDGGIFGQLNVGHIVKDKGTAAEYLRYWTDVSHANPQKRYAVKLVGSPVVDAAATPSGSITPVFSPRSDISYLYQYFRIMRSAKSMAGVTLPFGAGKEFNSVIDGTGADPLTMIMEDSAGRVQIQAGSHDNVWVAQGGYIDHPLYIYAKEQTTKMFGTTTGSLNVHVPYIHTKFLMHDPLGADPIVVTGSANFSSSSTLNNDENLLVIRGDPRVANIYFTEFNRIFTHYYFRHIHQNLEKQQQASSGGGRGAAAAATAAAAQSSVFLAEDDSWQLKYQNPAKLGAQRLQALAAMVVNPPAVKVQAPLLEGGGGWPTAAGVTAKTTRGTRGKAKPKTKAAKKKPAKAAKKKPAKKVAKKKPAKKVAKKKPAKKVAKKKPAKKVAKKKPAKKVAKKKPTKVAKKNSRKPKSAKPSSHKKR